MHAPCPTWRNRQTAHTQVRDTPGAFEDVGVSEMTLLNNSWASVSPRPLRMRLFRGHGMRAARSEVIPKRVEISEEAVCLEDMVYCVTGSLWARD